MTKQKNKQLDTILRKTYSRIPKIGEFVEGKISGLSKRGLFVDIDNFKTGVVYPKELKENPGLMKSLKIGDPVLVKIISFENNYGYLELSLKEAKAEQIWTELQEIMDSKKIFEAKVLKANKGGLILDIKGFQAFMPVSQLSNEHYPRVEGGDTQKILQALQKLVNKKLKIRIITLDRKEEKIIVSEKAACEEEKEKLIKKYKVGDIVEGTVTGIVDFGVFVKFDKLEGLVHISELDYQLIEDPHDIVKVGDKVKAKIISIDDDKISLSIKALKKNPWEKVEEKYKKGQIVKGTVTKFNPFGAFVQLDKKIHGLAHISEFGSENKMKEMLEIGKKYDFKILSIKPKEYRMALKPIFNNSSKRKSEK